MEILRFIAWSGTVFTGVPWDARQFRTTHLLWWLYTWNVTMDLRYIWVPWVCIWKKQGRLRVTHSPLNVCTFQGTLPWMLFLKEIWAFKSRITVRLLTFKIDFDMEKKGEVGTFILFKTVNPSISQTSPTQPSLWQDAVGLLLLFLLFVFVLVQNWCEEEKSRVGSSQLNKQINDRSRERVKGNGWRWRQSTPKDWNQSFTRRRP